MTFLLASFAMQQVSAQQDSTMLSLSDSAFWKTMQLGEITIKGQRPKTKLTGNSMITRIQGSVLEKSGTLKEMLAKVPGMTQKGDDLEVLGKGAPIYYINGRKMQDKDELKRLRASVMDVFQRNHQAIEMDCGYYTLEQRGHSNTHRLNLSLRYTFNAQKSKYKGTGAGKDAAGRMSK